MTGDLMTAGQVIRFNALSAFTCAVSSTATSYRFQKCALPQTSIARVC